MSKKKKNLLKRSLYFLRLQRYSRQMRRHPTPAERALQHAIYEWGGPVWKHRTFYFQKPFSIGYIADVWCPKGRFIVEIDGSSHDTRAQQEYDWIRTEWFKSQGIEVLRFKNQEVIEEPEIVLDAMLRQLHPVELDDLSWIK